MNDQDLNLVTDLGYALWQDPYQAQITVRDTVSAASLVEAKTEAVVDRTVRALLEQAEKRGSFARPGAQLFQSLFAEERFLLLALHTGRWSYARIARVLGESPDSVQTMAWNARVHLASNRGYPAGSRAATPSCPEYNAQTPWTQKFLDEEVKGQEKLFLQNHLVACSSCRDALMRAKEVFYRAESMLAEVRRDSDRKGQSVGLNGLLRQWVEQGQEIRKSSRVPSVQQNLTTFFKRWEVLAVLGFWVLYFAFKK
jgi:hypothetical protein